VVHKLFSFPPEILRQRLCSKDTVASSRNTGLLALKAWSCPCLLDNIYLGSTMIYILGLKESCIYIYWVSRIHGVGALFICRQIEGIPLSSSYATVVNGMTFCLDYSLLASSSDV